MMAGYWDEFFVYCGKCEVETRVIIQGAYAVTPKCCPVCGSHEATVRDAEEDAR